MTYCAEHQLLLGSIADLIAYREKQERLVELSSDAVIETEYGPIRATTWLSRISGQHHLALVKGDELGPGQSCQDPVVVRVQQEWPLTDVFGWGLGSRQTLHQHLQQIAEADRGVLLYLRDPSGDRLPAQIQRLAAASSASDNLGSGDGVHQATKRRAANESTPSNGPARIRYRSANFDIARR